MQRSRILWLAAPLALVAVAFWWLARGPKAISSIAANRPAEGLLAAAPDPKDPRTAYVLGAARDKGGASAQKLIDAYRDWAKDPSALDLRRLALGTLFKEPALGLKLQRVLDAVAADPTPPAEDKLWPEVVENLADQWKAENFDKGRDLMLSEERPRARRALVASWVRMAEDDRIGRFDEQQRLKLSGDFIDIYSDLEGDQQPEVARALRKLAGNDVAEILTGNGLEPNRVLETEAEEQRMLEIGEKALLSKPRADDDVAPRPLPPELEDPPDPE